MDKEKLDSKAERMGVKIISYNLFNEWYKEQLFWGIFAIIEMTVMGILILALVYR